MVPFVPTLAEDDHAVWCASCGLPLDGDPEDDELDAGGAMCGECNRARNFDAIEEVELLGDHGVFGDDD